MQEIPGSVLLARGISYLADDISCQVVAAAVTNNAPFQFIVTHTSLFLPHRTVRGGYHWSVGRLDTQALSSVGSATC